MCYVLFLPKEEGRIKCINAEEKVIRWTLSVHCLAAWKLLVTFLVIVSVCREGLRLSTR
jgi:hypothetical protein